jgi:hypothetical protein
MPASCDAVLVQTVPCLSTRQLVLRAELSGRLSISLAPFLYFQGPTSMAHPIIADMLELISTDIVG